MSTTVISTGQAVAPNQVVVMPTQQEVNVNFNYSSF